MSRIAKTTITLMVVTILSKILGFLRELVLGAVYGATSYSDVYITTFNIPTVLFASIGTALATTFIPLYYDNKNNGGDNKALKFTNNIFNIVLILGIILCVLVFIFAKPLVSIFAIGFNEQELNYAANFTKIMIFGGLMAMLSNIMTSFLQIEGNFIVPGLIGLPFNIIIILSIILSIKVNIYILPIGTLIAMISQFLFQLPFAYKYGYRYKKMLDVKDEYVKKMIWLVAPVFIGVAVNQVNAMVDRTLASTLVEGSISALNYANRLNGFVMGLFITSISAVIYPMLSKISNETNNEDFISIITKSINSVILLVIPISIGAIVLSIPIIRVLFERGAFDLRATNMTSSALIFYSIGMVGFGLRDILGKVFYSLQDTKTPMINGAIAVCMNIILNIILVKFMGHSGLAFATSISAIICIFILFNSLNKKIGYFGQDKILKTTLKSLVSAVIMGIVTYIIYNLFTNILGIGFIQEVAALFGSIVIGVIVYGILIILLKVDEVNMITDMVKKRLVHNGELV